MGYGVEDARFSSITVAEKGPQILDVRDYFRNALSYQSRSRSGHGPIESRSLPDLASVNPLLGSIYLRRHLYNNYGISTTFKTHYCFEIYP